MRTKILDSNILVLAFSLYAVHVSPFGTLYQISTKGATYEHIFSYTVLEVGKLKKKTLVDCLSLRIS